MRKTAHILITGNRGYVGSVLVPWLRKWRPEARLTGCDVGWFAEALTMPGTDPEAALDRQLDFDIRDLDAARLQDVDCIVHLAAVSNDPIGQRFEAATEAINAAGTAALGRAAKAAGVGRFVLASSCSVYGAASAAIVDEQSSPAPLSAYARSKVAGERSLRELSCASFMVTALRFGTACGFSPRLRLDLVLNDFVAGALASGEIVLQSTGNAWRPLVHVQDMAQAIGWALERTGEPWECVHVGSEQMTVNIRELADRVAARIPKTLVRMRPGSSHDPRSYRVSFDRFRSLAPRRQPSWTLEATIDELAAGLQALDFADQEFRKGPLIRLEALSALCERGLLDPLLRKREATCGA